jgi:hypothetical protein
MPCAAGRWTWTRRTRCDEDESPNDAPLVPYEPDHVIAVQHDGTTSLDNLAYTCPQCNHCKGLNLALIDPEIGQRTFLFHPRTDQWRDHFGWDAPRIMALTAVGRATAALLRVNDPRRALKSLVELGWLLITWQVTPTHYNLSLH